MKYPLTWLFTCQTTDGQLWQQTAQDRSTRFRELMLTPAVGPDTVVAAFLPAAPDYAGLLAQIDAGQDLVTWDGASYHWRLRGAYTDIADYVERGEVAWFKLAMARDPAHFVLLHLADDPAGCGDMEWHCAGMTQPLEIPFALPARLWQTRLSPDVSVGAGRPPLRLYYGRDVTVTGTEDTAAITDVVYQIGWRIDILGETLSHTVGLRGDL